MADNLRWGVWFEGSSVEIVADGLSAFRREAAYRRCGYGDAVAVWSVEGRLWWPVAAGDRRRPDPAPPPQARGWREVLARRGRKAVHLRRRGF